MAKIKGREMQIQGPPAPPHFAKTLLEHRMYLLNVQIVYKTPWMFRLPIYKLPIQAYYQTINVQNMNIKAYNRIDK